MLDVHLVARLRIRGIDLRERPYAPVLWDYLRARFARVLACILIPDHVHVLLEGWPAWAGRRDPRGELADLCGRFQRTCRLPVGSWERLPAPRPIANRRELRRQFRYVALNECRAELARDPLCARWSTYRELFGAVADPWVDAPDVLRRLDFGGPDGLRDLHAYVSGDPACQVAGTPLPTAATPTAVAQVPLGDLVAAAAAATRTQASAVTRRSGARRALVWLAARHGWAQAPLLARTCATTPDAIHRIARGVDPGVLAAVELCLGDPRLRTPLAQRR